MENLPQEAPYWLRTFPLVKRNSKTMMSRSKVVGHNLIGSFHRKYTIRCLTPGNGVTLPTTSLAIGWGKKLAILSPLHSPASLQKETMVSFSSSSGTEPEALSIRRPHSGTQLCLQNLTSLPFPTLQIIFLQNISQVENKPLQKLLPGLIVLTRGSISLPQPYLLRIIGWGRWQMPNEIYKDPVW